MDADKLQTRRVPAREMQTQPRREFCIAVVKDDSPAIVEPNHADHVLDLERVRQERMRHVLSGREGEFGLLKMKARLGKSIEVADVIVVEVGDDDVFDVGGAHPQEFERINGIAQVGALALSRHFLGEAAVDDEAALVADREPAEVIHGHRPVMRIAADEIVLPAALAGRIAQRIDLIARKVVIVRHGSRALRSLKADPLGRFRLRRAGFRGRRESELHQGAHIRAAIEVVDRSFEGPGRVRANRLCGGGAEPTANEVEIRRDDILKPMREDAPVLRGAPSLPPPA